MVKKYSGNDGPVFGCPTRDNHDKDRAIYADAGRYAAWRLKMGHALPALTLDMDDLTRDHITEVRRLMTEAQRVSIPPAEHARVVARYKDLRKDVAKLMAHMDVSAILSGNDPGPPVTKAREMHDRLVADRHRKLAKERISASPTLSEEATVPFKGSEMNRDCCWPGNCHGGPNCLHPNEEAAVPFEHEPLAGTEPF